MVEDLWNSVVQFPWSPDLAGLGMSFMLAFCNSFSFDCCWVCFLWVLASSWFTEGHLIHYILYSIVQVVLKLILLCVQVFEASLSLLFSCLFWVISLLFSYISRLVLDWNYFGIHSLLHLFPLLSVGGSFVGGFPLPAGILVFMATTYSFLWSIGGGTQNSLRPWECILWYSMY